MPAVSTLLYHNLALSLLVTGYVVLGALLFQALEAGPRSGSSRGPSVPAYRDECLRELWVITERLNVLYERNWTQLVDAQLRKFEGRVVEATRTHGLQLGERDTRWTFHGSVLYSLTVITTIGYGNMGPRSAEGKVVTMLYALVGVPLMLVCLSNLGTMLAHSFQAIYTRLCCGRHLHKSRETPHRPVRDQKEARSTLVAVATNSGKAVCSLTPEARQLLKKPPLDRDSDDDDPDHSRTCRQHNTPSRVPLIWRAPGESRRAPTPPPRRTPSLPSTMDPRVPPSLVLLLLVTYLVLGALLFAAWEGWSLLDAAYFCFVTLSTIGFGDMMPGNYILREAAVEGQYQTVACCAYLLLGLVLIATCFSLLQDEVLSKGRHLASAVGLVKQGDMAV